MCGIAGIAYADPSRFVSKELIEAMCGRIIHRGPDDSGIYLQGSVGIGMRRLSVIDVHAGHQPISNENGTVWIVFNGEIYNHQELRRDLETKGHRFSTLTDTEVIVHLYEELGLECVKSLRGMFAFAVWDVLMQRLFLARDRMGIKPLYYCINEGGLVFGSELKALLAVSDISREIDSQSVAEYFTHLCIPGGRSIYRFIKKLLPGHVLTFQDGKHETSRYWEIPIRQECSLEEGEWILRLQNCFTNAVTSHMVADVPVGAFLSGGVDSASMVAIMAKYSSSPVKTFTVGISDSASRFDERQEAQAVAARYRTEHFECLLEANVADLFPQVVRAMDEPFADSSVIPNWLICKETARHVKVALSGLGGDELFGGYERYLGLQLGETYRRLPSALRGIISACLRRFPTGEGFSYVGDRIRRFAEYSELPLAERYRGLIAAFYSLDDILQPELARWMMASRYNEIVSALPVTDPADFAMRVDAKLYLPDDLLRLSDQISMAHSLEVRVPFMDHLLVELAACMPSGLKIRGLEKKRVLKKAVEMWLPDGHVRRKKQGFSIPLAGWLRGSLFEMANDLIESHSCKSSKWINYRAARAMLDAHSNRSANHEIRIWGVLSFLEWQRQQSL